MREEGEQAEAGLESAGLAAGSRSCCSGARAPVAARAFPLRKDLRPRPSPMPKDTGMRWPQQLAPLGASVLRARLGCPGGRPTPPASPGSARGGRQFRRSFDSPKASGESVGASLRKSLHLCFPRCRSGSLFSKKRRELGKTAPFVPVEAVQRESEDNEMSTSWRIKKKKKSHPDWRCPF